MLAKINKDGNLLVYPVDETESYVLEKFKVDYETSQRDIIFKIDGKFVIITAMRTK